MLKAKNLCKSYHGKKVVKGIDFSVKQGEIVGLLGSNGAGKTTTFYMIMGLIKPDEGDVFFNDVKITSIPIHKRAKMGLGYLAQEPSIFRNLTVEENILCILEVLIKKKEERKNTLHKLLEELHLTHLKDEKAYTLSGGERRRLEITRTLATNPSLLLLDEPFANIDPLTVQDLKNIVLLLKKKNISVLITDHNAREIFSIADRSYLIQEGKVLLDGTSEELLNNEQARLTYFGSNFTI